MMKKDVEIKNIYYVMTLLIITMIMMVSVSLVDIGIFIFRDIDGYQVIDSVDIDIPSADAINQLQYVIIEEGIELSACERIKEQLALENLSLTQVRSLTQDQEKWAEADVMIVAGEIAVNQQWMDKIEGFVEQGGDLIILGLAKDNKETQFNQIIGVYALEKEETTKRLRTLEDFFLGGVLEFDVDDYPYTLVRLQPSAKQFVDDGKGNPIVWRNTYKGQKIYVVNGALMSSNSGYGVLTGVQTDIYSDYLYPVVGGMAHTYVGLPYLLNENAKMMLDNYQRDGLSVQEDIIIPDIIGITQSRDVIPSAFLSAGFFEEDYEAAIMQSELIKNYNRDFQKFGGYIGLATFTDLTKEQEIYQKVTGQEELTALYVDDKDKPLDGWTSSQQKMRTLLKPWELGGIKPVFEEEGIVEVPITYETMGSQESDKMAFYSIATSFGLAVHNMDMEKILYPDTAKDHWMIRSKDYAEFMDRYLRTLGELPSLNIQKLGERLRIYQQSIPWIQYEEDKIDVYIEGWQGEMHFILRTDKEILQVIGGNVSQIDAHSYQIDVYEPHATIELVR